jgi:hypothetical protein
MRTWVGLVRDFRSALPALEDDPLEDVTSFNLEIFRDYLLLGPGACFYLKASAIPIY